MKSITKLPRALLNATLGRGRNRGRLARLLLMVVLIGITYAIYQQLSQQTLKSAPGDGGMLKNIKERHVNDDDFGVLNPNNQVGIKYKDGKHSANKIAAERHQDTGESPNDNYREKANDIKQQQNADKAFDKFDRGDNRGQDKNSDQNEQNIGQERVKQENYQDGHIDDGIEADGDAIEEAVREEMAKLDLMELKRNRIVLSEDQEAAALPDGDNVGAFDADAVDRPGAAVVERENAKPADGGGEKGVEEMAALSRERRNEPSEDAGDRKDVEGAVADEVKAAGDDVAKDNDADKADDAGEDGEAGEAGEEAEKEAEREAELRRMTAEEVAAAIRSGEMCKSVCPPFVWSEWSPCSKACGRGRRYRKAIYEFVCQSSDLCPLNRIEESICETPCKFDPDKYGGPNGLDLYPINPLNPAIFAEERNYMCGHWLVEYEKIHNEILEGKRAPAYLVYSTGKGEYPSAGGLSGRIKGITTVFFMAVLLERAFLIEWLDPTGLENYLVPKSFNWADLTPIQHLKRGKAHDIGSWKAAKENGKSSQWYMDEDFSKYFKNPVEVIQGPRYDYTYAILRNPGLMPKAYELGIDRVKCRVCCAWDMLFKTEPKFEEEMNKLMRSLGYPVRPVVAVQARVKSDDVQKSVTAVEHYLNCAQKASKELKFKTPIYILILNNRLVVHILQKKYFRIMKTPIEIETATRTVHTHLGNLPSDTEQEVILGVQERTFKEFFLMLNSTLLVRAKGHLGSFGNVADAIRRHYGKPGTVYTYTSGGSSCALFPDGAKIE